MAFATLAALATPSRASADDAPTGQTALHPWPLVHVFVPRAPGMVELQARSPGASWRTTCVPPCRLRLDPGDAYRIGGPGVVDSDSFRLPPAGEIRVDASAGSTMLRDIGTLFMIAGSVFAAGGGAILLLPKSERDHGSDKAVVGVGFLTLGVLTAAVGIAARLASDTNVKISTSSAGVSF